MSVAPVLAKGSHMGKTKTHFTLHLDPKKIKIRKGQFVPSVKIMDDFKAYSRKEKHKKNWKDQEY
jgi:hypothetical protein